MLKVSQPLKAAISRQERAERSARFASDPRNAHLARMLISQEVHEWCSRLIRYPEKRLSHRSEGIFETVQHAISYVERVIDAEKSCIVFGYDLDVDASLLMPKAEAFTTIRERNTILSMDGLILSNVNVTSTFILDFEDADEQRCLSRVFCSVMGEMALNPRFPGSHEGLSAN